MAGVDPCSGERTGMAHATWIDIWKERTQPSPETCLRIADHLSISAATVLVLAGHLPPGAVGAGDPSPVQQEAARLTEDFPNEAWLHAALDQLGRLKQLAGEGARLNVVGGRTEEEGGATSSGCANRYSSVMRLVRGALVTASPSVVL